MCRYSPTSSLALSAENPEIGFVPERNNRYAYFLTATGTLEGRSTSTITQATTYTGISVDTFKYTGATAANTYSNTACSSAAGITGTPATVFVAVAQGNVDADALLDQWSISSDSRTLSGSGCTADANNPSGEPANDQNDVNL